MIISGYFRDIFIRFISSPKSNLMIITCRGQHVTLRMPCHTPNHGCMCFFNSVQMPWISLPINNLTIVRSTSKQLLLKRMPCNYCYLVIMLLEHIKLFHSSNIMYFERVISRPSQKPITINGIPSDLIDCIVMSLNSLNLLPWFRIPNLNIVIFATCHN